MPTPEPPVPPTVLPTLDTSLDTSAKTSLPPQILTKHGVQEGMTREQATLIAASPYDITDWLALLNRASAFYILGNDEAALAMTRESLRLHETAAGYINLAVIHSMLGQFIDATVASGKAYNLEPENRTAATIYCESLLRMGRWSEAWPLFHNYYDQSRVSMFSMVLPEWQPGIDLQGKRLLVIEGGGYGDNFFFARYLPRLKDLGAKLTYFCPAAMAGLMLQQSYIDEVIPTLKGEADTLRIDQFDYYTPLLSLGNKFSQRPFHPTQPSAYLHASPEIKLNSFMRVGFCPLAAEAGNPRPFRSMNEAQVKQFRSSFQGQEYVMLVPNFGWLENWLATACWIASCNLVITVDTGVAHLAAAMGKPTWVLVPGFSAWYYMVGMDTHPLYPNMRIFRNYSRGLDRAIADCLDAFTLLTRSELP